ncbi:MarR family winged helix-turn-helix transcriptional regulator [Cellulomonas soli]
MSATSAEMTPDAPPAGQRPAEPQVRWLDDEQQQHWRAFRDGTARLMAVLAHELEQASGLSLHEYEVMVRLSEAPGRTLRMSEIAEGLAHSRSRLTHTVRRMEDAGLVSRQPCAEDARGVNCTLTETGWQTLVAAAPRTCTPSGSTSSTGSPTSSSGRSGSPWTSSAAPWSPPTVPARPPTTTAVARLTPSDVPGRTTHPEPFATLGPWSRPRST